MSKNTPILAALHIPKPCHEDWQAMHGNAQQRFCDSCQHHVVNLSAMTSDAAET